MESVSERNLGVARLWFEQVWSKPDPDLADEIVDAGYAPEWIHMPKTGPAQVKHELRYFRSVFPDLVYEVVDAVAVAGAVAGAWEDKVWVRYRGRGLWHVVPHSRRRQNLGQGSGNFGKHRRERGRV